MNSRHLQIAGAAGPRIDGVDLAQLLRDLGEASATSSAVDLFGLCPNAQRVLVCLQTGVVTAPSAATEADLGADFHALSPGGRYRLCS